MSKVVAPDTVKRLVDTFDEHAAWYKSPDYRAAQLREELLNPLFEALGWDVYNKLGFAPHSKQVTHEDTLRMGGTTKAPDYSFRIGGYQVLDKWLKDRKKAKRKLTRDDVRHYQRIVVAIRNTIRLVSEIDKAIPNWPIE